MFIATFISISFREKEVLRIKISRYKRKIIKTSRNVEAKQSKQTRVYRENEPL